MRITAEPRSDQWNADDFIGGPRTFTIAGVKPGSAEQKYDIELVEGEGRAWRPPLTMLRLLLAAWGDDATTWVGRRVTLFRDETIRFGPDAVGGIRVSHMSDLPGGKPFETKVTATRGKRTTVRALPLPDEPQPITPDHMRVIKEHMERTGLDGAAVLSIARDISRREIGQARDLTASEADGVIAHLAELPAAGAEDGDPAFPNDEYSDTLPVEGEVQA